jgi:hypothetical protein
MAKRSKKPKSNSPKRKLLALGLTILVLALVIAILEISNTTYIFHKRKAVSGTILSTSPANNAPIAAGQADKKPPSSGSSADTSKSSTAVSDSNAPLIAPYGSFVSNHHPSLSGAGGVPSQEESVCTTTPGATCYMTFTQNGVVKTLKSQVADSKGSVFWDWDVNKSGFTTGSWSITATASLNGVTKSTNDSLELVVNQ